MTRVRLRVLRAIALLIVALAGLLGLATAELEFYQDVEPKLASEVSFERLMRILEAKSHSTGTGLHHQPQQLLPHLHQQPPPPPLPTPSPHQQQQQQQHLMQLQQQLLMQRRRQQRSHQQHLLELARQKQRGLLRDDMPERPNIIDVLQREAADPLEYVRELERQRLLPYLEYEPAPRIKPYSIEDEARARLIPAQANKDPMLDYPETHYVDLERARQLENARRAEEVHRRRPEFTYAFDKTEPAAAAPAASGTSEDSSPPSPLPPFAVGPNDPRYYEDDGVDEDDHLAESAIDESPNKSSKQKQRQKLKLNRPKQEKITHQSPMLYHHKAGVNDEEEKLAGKHQTLLKTYNRQSDDEEDELEEVDEEDEAVEGEGDLPRTGLVEVSVLPAPKRRAENDPLVVSLNHKVNNDIYFIAIVAGCSAAAMFALVLISLTWCRLQRVSKAAADVEYPAYGVTGPNKDISPSGDQRLAQSAQMYHFQHQKQQIIAMENRASATRDPGSVSEAESDEENEEGDYTVYECPGLAPTGEMEVKNPLFHDDPTPATPAKPKRTSAGAGATDDEDDV